MNYWHYHAILLSDRRPLRKNKRINTQFTFLLRGESKFEKFTLSVKLTLFSDPPTHQPLSVKTEVEKLKKLF